MKGLRLYKKEKLCSPTAIDMLFRRDEHNQSAIAYPLRAVWRLNPDRRSDSPVAFLISVPKRRFKHAVDRVAMRRRIREAYRLARDRFPMPDGTRCDVAFVYVADKLKPYRAIAAAVDSLLSKIQSHVETAAIQNS